MNEYTIVKLSEEENLKDQGKASIGYSRESTTTRRPISEVCDYLGSEICDIFKITKCFGTYQMALAAKAFQDLIKKLEDSSLKNFDYDSEVFPIYSSFQVDYDAVENFLTGGFIFAKYNGKNFVFRILLEKGIFGRRSLDIFTSRFNKKDAEEIISDILSYMSKNNFYRGKSVTLFGEFLKPSDLSLEDLILNESIKDNVKQNIFDFIEKKKIIEDAGLKFKRGVIFEGLPGTGKTLTGKILSKSYPTFIWITTLESSREIEAAFQMARELSPSIIFLEDLDASNLGSGKYRSPMLKTLLVEMDGLKENDGIITIATSNFPGRLDIALRDRPSRFDARVNFELPDEETRKKLLKYYLKKNKTKIDLDKFSKETVGLTPAYIKEICILMILYAIQGNSFEDKTVIILQNHALQALDKIMEYKRRNEEDTGEFGKSEFLLNDFAEIDIEKSVGEISKIVEPYTREAIGILKDKVLIDDHRWMHVFWEGLKAGKKFEKWNEKIVDEQHSWIVSEMLQRGFYVNYSSDLCLTNKMYNIIYNFLTKDTLGLIEDMNLKELGKLEAFMRLSFAKFGKRLPFNEIKSIHEAIRIQIHDKGGKELKPISKELSFDDSEIQLLQKTSCDFEIEKAVKAVSGLYLVSPHGSLIVTGDDKGKKKTLIIKKKKFEAHIGEPVYLLQDDDALGVINLKKPFPITHEEFLKLRPKHMISDKEAMEWWDDLSNLYGYEFEIVETFKKPKKYIREPGVQVWVSEVKFKQYAPVASSGIEIGDEIHFENAIKDFRTFNIVDDFIYLSKDYFKNMKCIKLLIRGQFSEGLVVPLNFRLGRMVSFSDNLIIEYKPFDYDFSGDIPLFSLVSERINEENKIFEMSIGDEQEDFVQRADPLNYEIGKELKSYVTPEEVESEFKDFKLRQPFIYMVGGICNKGKTKGDADILIKGIFLDYFRNLIIAGMKKYSKMPDRLHFLQDYFHGPFTSNTPIFDLVVKRIPSQITKFFFEKQAKTGKAQLMREAETSMKEDKVSSGEFFKVMKPTRGALVEQRQTIDNFVALFPDEDFPVYCTKKYDGANQVIWKLGNKIWIISEDGEDNTSRLPQTVEEIKQIPVHTSCCLGETELWEGEKHLPRETIAGYLHSKSAPDDSDIVTNIYDTVYFDTYTGKKKTDLDVKAKDIHNVVFATRNDGYMKLLEIKQSTTGVPNLKYKLNLTPASIAHDRKELKDITTMLSKLPGSEGNVAKPAKSIYVLHGRRGQQIKFHNSEILKGIVYDRIETKVTGVYNYQYAVAFEDENISPDKLVKIGGKDYALSTKTFSTSKYAKKGNIIVVEFETMNLIKNLDEDTVEVTFWAPRVMDVLPEEKDPETIKQITSKAKKSYVYAEKHIKDKEIIYKGNVEKQVDIYLENPSEDETYKFVCQHHARGKSFHTDFRIEHKDKKVLLGWTIADQIAGKIKEPILTFKDIVKADNDPDNWKINWQTGEWKQRLKAGQKVTVNVEIFSSKKAPEPVAWLNFEGVTKPGTVGATKEFPGVFHIVDKGICYYGMQKTYAHEYFPKGKAFNYKLLIRKIKFPKTEEFAKILGKTWKEISEFVFNKIEFDDEILNWAQTTSSLYEDNFEEELLKQIFKDELTDEDLKVIETLKFSGDNVIKQDVLPPSMEERETEELQWLAIKPKDQTPYTLTSGAVKKKWMPPLGISALPKKVRDQVPPEFRYWNRKVLSQALAMRDALVQAIKDKEVKIDFEKDLDDEGIVKVKEADFVLQHHYFRGPTVVRAGVSAENWDLRLDLGVPNLLHFELEHNPLVQEETSGLLKPSKDKASMTAEGYFPPGTPYNPTKATPAFIDILDKGKVTVLIDEKNFKKFDFKGKKLKGLWTAESKDMEIWVVKESKLPEPKKNFEMPRR